MEVEIQLLEMQPSMLRSLRSQVSRNERPTASKLVKQFLFARLLKSIFVYQQNSVSGQRRNTFSRVKLPPGYHTRWRLHSAFL